MLAHAPSWLAAGALFFLMALTFFDVMLRSVFNSPIEAATELTRICMAILVFASLPIVSWRGEQIVVDLLDTFYAPKLARVRDVAVDLICGLALLVPTWRVFGLAQRAMDYGDLTEYLHIPQFYIGYFVATGTLLTAIVLIVRAVLAVFAPSLLPRSGQDIFSSKDA